MLIPDQDRRQTVVGLMKENRQHALTSVSTGDWGVGKSSVPKVVESGMAGDGDVACVWFNG